MKKTTFKKEFSEVVRKEGFKGRSDYWKKEGKFFQGGALMLSGVAFAVVALIINSVPICIVGLILAVLGIIRSELKK